MYRIYIIVMLFFSNSLTAVDIGSDTAVTRFNSVQILNDGDRIAGFAGLNAGFKLFDADTTGIFDSFFSVAGELGLRGGTLVLTQDLLINKVSEFQTLGNIVGNGRSIEFNFLNEFVPSRLSCDIELAAPPTVSPTLTSLSLDWSFDSSFFALSLDFTTVDLVLIGVLTGGVIAFPTSIGLPAPLSTITSVRWHPSSLLMAATRLQSSGGDELFTISFTPPTTLSIVDSDGISAGDYTACAWHPSGNFLAVGGTESASQIKIYPVSGAGVLDFAGTLTVAISPDRSVQREALDWDITGSYLAVGVDHISGTDADLLVYQFSPEPFLDLTLNATALVETGTAVLAVNWNHIFPEEIAIGISGGFSDSVQLYQHSDGGGGLLAGALANRGGISDLSSVDVEDVHWRNNGTCLLVGRSLVGSSGAFRVYSFDEDIPQFDLVNNFAESAPVGTTRWSPNGRFAASGTSIGLDVAVYESMVDATNFIWSDIGVFLNNNIHLRECSITFTGDCLLHGRGNTLTLEPDCEIFVGAESNLLIQDICIEGINNGRIVPLDSTSTVSFKDVTLIMDADYSFTQGRFDVIRNLNLEGQNCTFQYQSDQVSTVIEEGVLSIGSAVTFKYDPSIASKNLLILAAPTSTMLLNSATLLTTSTGLQLTKGNLIIEGDSSFVNQGDVASEGISWGDGVSAENNLCVEWCPAANLIVDGQFVNNNI